MKVNWKRTTIITIDIILALYLIAAFMTFNKPDQSEMVCKAVTIRIEDENANGFITATDIKQRLDKAKLYPLNKQMVSVSGRAIEELLKKSAFVKTADCYKTIDGTVNISISQRLPLLRVKANNGDDYYLDDNYQVMPNSHYCADLIIATGNIQKAYAQNYIAIAAKALEENTFWKNQIVQINALSDKGIELIPRVGDHIIYIGELPENPNKKIEREQIKEYVTKKMTRLEKFYKYGLSQAGWNKYAYINIEFDNQIICKKKMIDEKEKVEPLAN